MAIEMEWKGDHRFEAVTPTGVRLAVDGDRETGTSPMEGLLVALAACMGIDVVDILRKGRQELTGCRVRVSGTRREEPPRRYTSIAMTFELAGRDLSREKAERAVALSRDTYCSVWRSLADDITLETTIELVPPG